MGKAITMADLEAINFPHYYNLVKEGKMKAKEVKDLLFGGNPNKYNRYRRFIEGKQATSQKRKEYQKERRKANPDYWKEWNENNKDKKKEHYKNNKEHYKDKNKERYEAKVQQALEGIRIMVEDNPTKYDYIPGMKIYGIIYLVYNRITKRYYVGQTTVSFDIRYIDGFFHNHIDDKENSDLPGYPNELLKQDLELYGEESFEFNKIFKVASNKYELDKIEAYYIDHFNSYEAGYNRTRGNWLTDRGLEDIKG